MGVSGYCIAVGGWVMGIVLQCHILNNISTIKRYAQINGSSCLGVEVIIS